MRRLRIIPFIQRPSPSLRNFSQAAPRCRAKHEYDTEGRTPGFARGRLPQRPLTRSSNQDNVDLSPTLDSQTDNAHNSLLSPVHIPEDPHAIIKSDHPSTSLLSNSSIVVQRQLEMMNVFMGFEQANKYVIMDPSGGHIGYLAETDGGIGSALKRQAFRTHRSFTTHVFDRNEKEVLRFHRPFSWISSAIRVYDPVDPSSNSYDPSTALHNTSTNSIITQNQLPAQISQLPLSSMRLIGEAQQQWAPLRRKYNLFLQRDLPSDQSGAPQLTSGDLPLSNSKALQLAESDKREPGFQQFAYVDEPFLSWDFSLKSADNQLIGSVNRNFVGFAREIFTDTGVYALRMDAAGQEAQGENIEKAQSATPGMTLDQRAVMLATAVSIDFDYFSRHSGAGGGFGFPMPIWLPIPFGGAAPEAAGAGAAGAGAAGAEGAAAGTAVEGAEAGTAVRGAADAAKGPLGAGEGAIAGAGSLAGYDALQRARDRQAEQRDDFVPDEQAQQQQGQQQEQEMWDPWGQNNQGQDPWGGGGDGGGGGGGGDGGGGGFDDFF